MYYMKRILDMRKTQFVELTEYTTGKTTMKQKYRSKKGEVSHETPPL